MIKSNNEKMRLAILEEIKKDEYEYCFDKNYCNDEMWEIQFGKISREQAFEDSIKWHETLSLNEIFNHYDDKYNYVKI